jgi:hypothetical protein
MSTIFCAQSLQLKRFNTLQNINKADQLTRISTWLIECKAVTNDDSIVFNTMQLFAALTIKQQHVINHHSHYSNKQYCLLT